MFNGVVAAADQPSKNHVILEFEDGPFVGVKFYYDGMKFAEEENEDGSITMSFNYEIVEGSVPEESLELFQNILGDTIHKILEEQVKKGEAIYKGGT